LAASVRERLRKSPPKPKAAALAAHPSSVWRPTGPSGRQNQPEAVGHGESPWFAILNQLAADLGSQSHASGTWYKNVEVVPRKARIPLNHQLLNCMAHSTAATRTKIREARRHPCLDDAPAMAATMGWAAIPGFATAIEAREAMESTGCPER